MDRAIKLLREMYDRHEKAFITNSIETRRAGHIIPISSPQEDLDMLIDLGAAICLLEDGQKTVESNNPEFNFGYLVGVLKYAVEETGRISGDHDGTAGIKSPTDNYMLIARDYVEKKTDFVFETEFVGPPSEGHTITEAVDSRIFKSEADKKKYFEDLAMSLHNMVMGGCTVSNLKDVLIRKFDWLKM